MKVGELKRWLSARGVSFEDGKRHTLACLGSRFAPIPRHAGQEVKTGTLRAIMKQLGLKPPAKR